MAKKVSLKAFLRCADPKQQVEIVVVSFRECPTDDEEPFKIVYLGDTQNVPEEYEKRTIWYWGVRIEDTMFFILE